MVSRLWYRIRMGLGTAAYDVVAAELIQRLTVARAEPLAEVSTPDNVLDAAALQNPEPVQNQA